MAAEVMVGETPDDEQNGKHDEADKLKDLAADSVNCRNCQPVTRNGTSTDEDAVTSSQVVELVVDGRTTTIANSLENSGRVQTETVEGDIEQEPRHGGSEENLAISELAVEAEEVGK